MPLAHTYDMTIGRSQVRERERPKGLDNAQKVISFICSAEI